METSETVIPKINKDIKILTVDMAAANEKLNHIDKIGRCPKAKRGKRRIQDQQIRQTGPLHEH
jgi:hypothetical protein